MGECFSLHVVDPATIRRFVDCFLGTADPSAWASYDLASLVEEIRGANPEQAGKLLLRALFRRVAVENAGRDSLDDRERVRRSDRGESACEDPTGESACEDPTAVVCTARARAKIRPRLFALRPQRRPPITQRCCELASAGVAARLRRF